MKKRISILGATGSVGSQSLEVAETCGYPIDFLTGNKSVDKMEAVARRYNPRAVAMADEQSARELKIKLADTNIKVLAGESGIVEGIRECGSDTVINAILGRAGLLPTLEVLEGGATLALANKEALVVAGEIVMKRAGELGKRIIPVDSEHSAIFQSMQCGSHSEIKRIILTASGGPFYGMSADALESVTLTDALAHPTWKMGRKITVDSATLMNKGFEIIEAAHLFGVPADRIEVVIHRESILHSAVEYIDNAIIGEFSVPDMRMCVKYALEYPERQKGTSKSLDLPSIGRLSFASPDTRAFPLLTLAGKAALDGGASGAVLNAADEIAVEAFLCEQIRFVDISEVVMQTYEILASAKNETTLESILDYDAQARIKAKELISRI